MIIGLCCRGEILMPARAPEHWAWKDGDRMYSRVVGSTIPMKDEFKDALREARWPFYTPIVIHNRDQLFYLQQLVMQLHFMGYHNIYILDNNSTYPPLLAFYEMGYAWVYFMVKNFGSMALFESNMHLQLHGRFVLTDSDVIFTSEAPNDWLRHFWNLLDKYPDVMKVGAQLKIDDLPNTYPLKREVQFHECQSWLERKKVPGQNEVYRTLIDTTLALYREGQHKYLDRWQWLTSSNTSMSPYNALRVGGKYSMQHLPWYQNFRWMPLDELYSLRERDRTDRPWYGFWSKLVSDQFSRRKRRTTWYRKEMGNRTCCCT